MAHDEHIVQVGWRGIGSARVEDYQDALDWGVTFVMADEVAQSGYARAVEAIPEGSDVVVCFDCDGLDPTIMPAVIAPTNGGLSYQQALGMIRSVAQKSRIVGFDLVEFMPSADVNGRGARTAAQLLAGVLGTIARQR
jgi:agmatinase